MTRLPRDLSGRECVRALERAGFQVRRQTGSHIIMKRDDPHAVISIPNHAAIKLGTLRSILRQADLTVEEFVSLL